MKKIQKLLILIILMLIPSTIFAREGISNYYVDATILSNGDLSVKELVVLNGEFNGYERIIKFINPYAPSFNNDLNSFESSDIYNGDDLELISIEDIDVSNNYDFYTIYMSGNKFEKVDSANIGDYGVYEEHVNNSTKIYKIYNPSNGEEKGFYIEYIIKNIAVKHNDTAELYWNMFTTGDLREYINEYELHLNIPSNTNLRAWAHGPLNGDVSLEGNNKVVIKVSDVKPGTAFDLRATFDSYVISGSTKSTNVDAMDSILAVEEKLANEANNARDAIKLQYYALGFLAAGWIVGTIVLMSYMYVKYDKERNSSFKVKYFREFPANYGPEIVGYLFSKSIGNKELSASIVNLVTKKVISFEEITPKKYTLKYIGVDTNLTAGEKHLIDWLFVKIGKDNQVTMEEINKSARTNYDEFLKNYNSWKTIVMADAKAMDFFEKEAAPKVFAALFSLFGILIAIYNINLEVYLDLSAIMMALAVLSFIYFVTITKRTEKGNEEYVRWKGLKNFLNDFGRFQNRDLPMVVLWEKYLVYALIFGIADKLAKTMQIKFAEINQSNAMPNAFDIHYMNNMLILNRSINSGVTNAIGTATSMSAAAHSRSSSGGGFGGGFSSGGGFGGGGGGGGRF